MHAFLVINSDPLLVATKMNAKVIEHNIQKIEDVRELNKLTKFSFPVKTAFVIRDIDNITIEAANAFLKNLEEPNLNVIYILTATNLSNVLPTILSRCEVVKSKKDGFLKEVKHLNYKDALNIKDRVEAIKFVEDFLVYLESKLVQKHDLVHACESCLITIRNLKDNGNVSLQLANFVVKMSSTTI